MEEIKVGEWIRTKTGYIGQLNKISTYKINNKDKTMYLCRFSKSSWVISLNDIVKHSSNIIDLIQEGDYVNGYLVQQIDKDGFIVIHNGGYTFRSPNWIKSIVTKEQFKSDEYIVGESNG